MLLKNKKSRQLLPNNKIRKQGAIRVLVNEAKNKNRKKKMKMIEETWKKRNQLFNMKKG